MVPKPTPTLLFHITAIDNLRSIAGSSLLSKNRVAGQGINFADIAFQTVQGHRSVKLVPIASGGNLHDYVPFHFAPRSPMLKTIDSGNVEGSDFRQDDIVHLTTSVEAIVAAGLPFVFTNYHAVKAFAEFFDDRKDLDKIDWELFSSNPSWEGIANTGIIPIRSHATLSEWKLARPSFLCAIQCRLLCWAKSRYVRRTWLTAYGVPWQTPAGALTLRSFLAGTTERSDYGC